MIDMTELVEALRELGSQNEHSGKTWTSYGQVLSDANGTRSVRFNDANGAPLAHGVLIDVKLAPSGSVVPCRLASSCAGNGEGEYHPYVAGDEVLVVIPEGDEKAGCVIIGRLNQSSDVFPTTVAGMDVTTNTFGFKRHAMPFVVETGSSYMIRSAATGASFCLDQTGQVFLSDADGTLLAMTPDVVSLMIAGEKAGLQIDVSNEQTNIIGGATNLQINAKTSQLQTGGTFSVSTMGNIPNDHVATVEGMVMLFAGFMTTLAEAIAVDAAPLTGTSLAALLAPPASIAIISGGIAQSVLLPLTPFLPAISAALSVKKIPLLTPTPGCAGFLAD